MKLRNQLFLGFSIIIFLLIGVSIVSIYEMCIISNLTSDLYEHPFTVNGAVLNVKYYVMKMHRDMKNVVLSDNTSEMDAAVEDVDLSEKKVYENFSIIQERYLGNKKDIKEAMDTFEAWKVIRDEVIALKRSHKDAEARLIAQGKANIQVDKIEQEINDIKIFAGNKALSFMKDAKNLKNKSIVFTVIILILAIITGTVIAFIITGRIATPIKKISEDMVRLGCGDLTVEVSSARRSDEIGILIGEFKKMVENLNKQTREIVTGTNILAAAVSEMSVATTQLAYGFSTTAAAVSETTTTIEELKQTAEINSQKAKQLSVNAQKATQTSHIGKKATDDTVAEIKHIRKQMGFITESISKLNEQSLSIGELIATVGALAEQSSILAVHAAIEAVKAGEHGKGFSVVAFEVKNLAEQSKKAANQVRVILNDIQKSTGVAVMATEQGSEAVEKGVTQSARAGEAIMELAMSVKESSQEAIQIGASSQQQMIGMEQVTLAVRSINDASNQNLESTRQFESSIKNLDDFGKKLKKMVEIYKV